MENATLGQLERLHLLGGNVAIMDGKASVTGRMVASLRGLVMRSRVRGLRREWRLARQFSRLHGYGRADFWEDYVVARYYARLTLGSRWFSRV